MFPRNTRLVMSTFGILEVIGAYGLVGWELMCRSSERDWGLVAALCGNTREQLSRFS